MAGATGSAEWGGAAEVRGCTIQGLALEGWGKGVVTRSVGSGLRLPDLQCQGHHQPAVWPWGSHLLPPSLCILGVKRDDHGSACLTRL